MLCVHEQCVHLINRTEGKGVKEVVGADQDLELVELPAEEYPCTILEHLQVTTWDVSQYIYMYTCIHYSIRYLLLGY